MKALLAATALVALAVLAACGSPAASESRVVAHRVLATEQHCGKPQPQIETVTDAGPLSRLVAGDSLPAGAPHAPAADFARDTVLWLGMGELRSTGGQVSVVRVEADAGHRLVVHTQWTLPAPGQIHAAVMTSPCVVFSVPRGDHRSVQVLDSEGRERLAVGLAPGR
jgi:hypothetical protein